MKPRFFTFVLVCTGFVLLLSLAGTTDAAAGVPATHNTRLLPLQDLSQSTPLHTGIWSDLTGLLPDTSQAIIDGVAAVPPVCKATPTIMPLGNSITKGLYAGSDTDMRPDSQITGYRQPLFLSLKDSGRNVNFVGSQKAGGQARPIFDPDHEGHPGQTTSFIANNIFTWLNGNPADVVLLHIGTNDVSGTAFSIAETVDNVAHILDEIDRHNKRTIVILALIINRSCSEGNTNCENRAQLTTDFNKALKSMAQARIATGDQLIIVNMEDGAGIIYKITPQGDMADSLHPHDSGYDKMAAVWLKALAPILPTHCAYLPLTRSSN